MSFDDLARAHEAAPGATTYAALRAAILAESSYRADLDPDEVARSAQSPAMLVARLEALMPGAHLSPGAHGHLAEAHATLGDDASAEEQRRLVRHALSTILGTGDGSEAAPWQVLRVSDEYDVLRVLGRRSVAQTYVVRDAGRFDRHDHADGSRTWFDVTAIPELRAGG